MFLKSFFIMYVRVIDPFEVFSHDHVYPSQHWYFPMTSMRGARDHVQQALQRSAADSYFTKRKWGKFFLALLFLFVCVCVRMQPLDTEYVKCLVAVASSWMCSNERGRSGWNRSRLRWVQYLQAQDWQRKQNPGMMFSYKQLQAHTVASTTVQPQTITHVFIKMG